MPVTLSPRGDPQVEAPRPALAPGLVVGLVVSLILWAGIAAALYVLI